MHVHILHACQMCGTLFTTFNHHSIYICFILQTVVQPVGTEEHANVHLPMLTVTVPVGTRETTARTEVCIAAHTSMQHGGSCSMVHARMYIHT